MSEYDFNSEEWFEALEKARRNHVDEVETAVRIVIEKLRANIRAEAEAKGISEDWEAGGIIVFAEMICEHAIQKFNVEISPSIVNILYFLTIRQLKQIYIQMFNLQTIEQLESLIDEPIRNLLNDIVKI